MLGIAWLSFNIILAAAGIFYVLDYFGFLQTIPFVNTLSGKIPQNPILLIGAFILVAVGFGWVSIGSVGDTVDNEAPGPDITTDIKDQQTVDLEESSGGGGWSEQTLHWSFYEKYREGVFGDTDTCTHSTDVMMVDVNNDGNLDLVHSISLNANKWYENNGEGTFTEHNIYDADSDGANADYKMPVQPFQPVDITGNGLIDFAEGNEEGDDYWYENDGDGTFTNHTLPTSKNHTYALKVGDHNNDGHPDLYYYGLDDLTTGREIRIYSNNGDGTFSDVGIDYQDPLSFNNDYVTLTLLETADLTGNGYTDFITVNYISTGYVSEENYIDTWYENNGDGTYTRHDIERPPLTNPDTGTDVLDIDTSDITGNGYNDIVIAVSSQADIFYENNGDGTFTAHRFNEDGVIEGDGWSAPSSGAVDAVDDKVVIGNEFKFKLFEYDSDEGNLVYTGTQQEGEYEESVAGYKTGTTEAVALGDVFGNGALDLTTYEYSIGHKLYKGSSSH